MSPIELFLDEMRLECGRRFEPAVASQILAEVESHLAESVEARMELGESLESAERSAVAAFRGASNFTKAMEKAHFEQSPFDLVLLGCGISFLVLVFLLAEFQGNRLLNFLGLAAMCVLFIGFGIRTTVKNSFRWGTMIQLGLAALVVAIALSGTTLSLWKYGGMGYVRVDSTQAYIYERERELEVPQPGVDASYIQVDLDAVKLASRASLFERCSKSFSYGVKLSSSFLGLLLAAHFFLVGFGRIWRSWPKAWAQVLNLRFR